jgi:hypothetical protein
MTHIKFRLFIFQFCFTLLMIFFRLFIRSPYFYKNTIFGRRKRICLRFSSKSALVRTSYEFFILKTHSFTGIAQSFGVRAMKVSEP